ncbi:MAG: YtxH domain-containing protein, partial [bacterium]|nr:YtxH domain-containing protein [Candidatus Kapabacteria bacterium]
MSRNQDDETSGLSKGLLIGLLTGGAVGASLALLFAPKSGRELRSDITDTTNEYVERVSEMVSSATERAQQIVNDGRERADTIVGEARDRASTLLSDAEKIVSDARAKAGGQASRIADATKAGSEAFKEEIRAPASTTSNNGP